MSGPLKIYGERNTGTRYLSRIVHLNLRVDQLRGVLPPYLSAIQRHLPRASFFRGAYFGLTYRRNLGWKHAVVSPPEALRREPRIRQGVCLLSLTKNPYAWLLSLYRRPHHQYFDAKPVFLTFLDLPWRTEPAERCERPVRNPVELWNIKNASYLGLPEVGGLTMRAEDLLRSPESAIETIAAHFNLERRTDRFINVEKSTKGEDRVFGDYQDYYLNERWRAELSNEAIALINWHLDLQVLGRFGYELLS